MQHVYKVDAKIGTELWRFPAAGTVQVVFYAPPLLNEGSVFVGDLANKFHKLDSANGSEIWNFSEGKGWFQARAAMDGVLVIAPSSDRSVYALNADAFPPQVEIQQSSFWIYGPNLCCWKTL
jgi:outer membrane protein assembly factor BamB